MNSLLTPTFVSDLNDPADSTGFVLILTLARDGEALNQLCSQSLDALTDGRPTSCLVVLVAGLTNQPAPDQLRQLHQLSRRWRVAVEAVESAEAAAGFGAWLLGEFHRLFHHCGEEAFPGALELACLRQMSQDAVGEFVRPPRADPIALPAS